MSDPIRTILVSPHDPTWAGDYARQAEALRRALAGLLHEIYHIGSTAIPGLPAKPTIDILAGVEDLAKLDSSNDALRALGYLPYGEYGIPGRRFFIRERLRAGRRERTHHLHAFQVGDPHIARHLRFRDYLIAHRHLAKQYGTLKIDLAARYPHDIDAYCAGKDAFIKEIDALAAAWTGRIINSSR